VNGLRTADSVEVFSLVDNALEMIYHIGREDVQRPREWNKNPDMELPMAEHGFAALVRTHVGGEAHTLLFDTGPRPGVAVENARRLGLGLGAVEAVMISHGHWDHYGGLLSALEAIGKRGVPVLIHRNMFHALGHRDAGGRIHESGAAALAAADAIRAAGGEPTDSAEPTLVAGDTVLVTGEIPRRTAYETGYPGVVIKIAGEWQPYEDMRDERAVAIIVAGRGLVVITGCGHAGVVNTVRCAQELTGVDRLHMVMGGFHLAGVEIEARIPQTVRDIAGMNPALLVPCHCTGFPAAMAFAQAMPGAFVANSVGNRYLVGSFSHPQET
jgi:7,8-dihydropterin-6-yl-methyl-4-(beta-D-ribofuranosyl)aminobenzene 5'-phosphate synthase